MPGCQQHPPHQTANALISLYGKRWSIECEFRDTKDLRFGMGMASIHLSTPARRDRLWLLNTFAIMLLTLPGCRRGTGIRSIPQVKHHQAAHSLAVPAGLHALRSDPQYAGPATVAAGRAVRRYAHRTPRIRPVRTASVTQLRQQSRRRLIMVLEQ